jgi:hypothetical protein
MESGRHRAEYSRYGRLGCGVLKGGFLKVCAEFKTRTNPK